MNASFCIDQERSGFKIKRPPTRASVLCLYSYSQPNIGLGARSLTNIVLAYTVNTYKYLELDSCMYAHAWRALIFYYAFS